MGFECESAGSAMKGPRTLSCLAVQANDRGCKVGGFITLQQCEFCQPMELAGWQGNRENLMGVLSQADKENPSGAARDGRRGATRSVRSLSLRPPTR